jgi:L-seryl-tRNA(Ser) seleniumtransferase
MMSNTRSTLRRIPAVETVLQQLGETRLPRRWVLRCVRTELGRLRTRGQIPENAGIIANISAELRELSRRRLQPVINATGVVIHTNLGRAPLGAEAVAALTDAAQRYNNLELSLGEGGRGARAGYVEESLALLCHAEAATVVNNCAAALVLMLRHFTARKREVVISRGELVQIGGGFRIPEILESSGARLREVGTTNRTTLHDYARAIGTDTGLILKVHQSNFAMEGFVESPTLAELAALAHKRRVPLIEDLGSGAVVDTAAVAGLDHEPTPAESLRAGADLVCFSGDKLFGGPQAGIIIGSRRWIRELKKDPFYRALRCDKLILAALQATTDAYLRDNAYKEIPTHQLLHAETTTLRRRANKLIKRLAGATATITVAKCHSQVGGGTLPRAKLDSIALEVQAGALPAAELARRLRTGSPPVIATVVRNCVRLDLRTVFPAEDVQLAEALTAALAAS